LDNLRAKLLPIDNIAVTADSNWYWVRVSHKYRYHELGTVEIAADGYMTGTGTTFTEVLRGQATDVPTKIKLIKSSDLSPAVNSGYYELVDVVDSTTAILAGTTTFTPETSLHFVVIGATPINENISVEQAIGLYQYDDCEIELVQESVLDTPPTVGFTQDKTFYLARIQNTGGSLTIQDKRTEYYAFNISGISDKLEKNQNLNDLLDKAAARDNLSVYSKTETDSAVNTRLGKASNLSDLTDLSIARTNLSVYSRAELGTRNTLNLTASDPTNFAISDATAYYIKFGQNVTISATFTMEKTGASGAQYAVTFSQSVLPSLQVDVPVSVRVSVGTARWYRFRAFVNSVNELFIFESDDSDAPVLPFTGNTIIVSVNFSHLIA
jgi:hypothetical protein